MKKSNKLVCLTKTLDGHVRQWSGETEDGRYIVIQDTILVSTFGMADRELKIPSNLKIIQTKAADFYSKIEDLVDIIGLEMPPNYIEF